MLRSFKIDYCLILSGKAKSYFSALPDAITK
jgi:hypothetical protein